MGLQKKHDANKVVIVTLQQNKTCSEFPKPIAKKNVAVIAQSVLVKWPGSSSRKADPAKKVLTRVGKAPSGQRRQCRIEQ